MMFPDIFPNHLLQQLISTSCGNTDFPITRWFWALRSRQNPTHLQSTTFGNSEWSAHRMRATFEVSIWNLGLVPLWSNSCFIARLQSSIHNQNLMKLINEPEIVYLTVVSRKRAHPSACGKTSCFKTSLNAQSSYHSKNEFSVDNPSQLSSGPLPFTFFKLISVTDAAYVLKVHVTLTTHHTRKFCSI